MSLRHNREKARRLGHLMADRDDVWRHLAAALETRRQLRCVECGRIDDGRERGWTLRIGDDTSLYAFCPDCESWPSNTTDP